MLRSEICYIERGVGHHEKFTVRGFGLKVEQAFL